MDNRQAMADYLYICYTTAEGTVKEIKIRNLPGSISHSRTSEFSDISFLGRFSPIYIYNYGSAEVYSFSITLHEDDLVGNEQGIKTKITDFTNELKSVAFPVEESGRVKPTQVVPRIERYPYFQLGELKGYGIIETEVSWKTPFRNGRYIVADVSFKITIEDSRYGLTPTITRVDGGEDIRFVGVPTEIYETKYYADQLLYKSTKSIGVDSSQLLNFLVDPSIAHEDYTKMRYAEQHTKVTRLYEKFETAIGGGITSKTLKNIGRLSLSSGNLPDKKTFESTIKALENSLKSDLNQYYNDNRNMLPEERDAIIEETRRIFLGLEEIYEEAYGYGASR